MATMSPSTGSESAAPSTICHSHLPQRNNMVKKKKKKKKKKS